MDARRAAGFSLFELILVPAILSLLAALVVPSFSAPLESARLRESAAYVRATLAQARTLAVSEARSRSVVFDVGRGEYGIEGQGPRRSLPDGIELAAEQPAADGPETGIVRVRFYADGTADEAGVSLTSSGGGRIVVLVEPLTGFVRAES